MASSSTTEISPLLISQSLGKHSREGGDYPDDPDQALKRVKAKNSRRRRKRGRGETADGGMDCDIANEHDLFQTPEQHWFQGDDGQISADYPLPQLQQPQRPRNPGRQVDPDNLSPEEALRRERVRASARERQRKHRALVKERKTKALGLDEVGTEAVMENQGGVLEYHQQMPQSQQYQQLLQGSGPPQPHNNSAILYPPLAPQIAGSASAQATTGGEMFATTLLLSFSCAPLLKQHLLDNLQMTNEELASLEPLIADAWEQWNAKRQEHFDPNQQSVASDASESSSSTPSARPGAIANDFRTRFQRSVATSIPFQTTTGASPRSDALDRSLSEATD